MIHRIQSKNFIIEDVSIIDFLQSKGIEHLRFNIAFDNTTYISVQFPDYENIITLGKQWLKITFGKNKVYVRTPSFLRGFIGKEVKIIKENREFSNKFEAFRIDPIGFHPLDTDKKNRIRVPLNHPYFSQSGYCAIPKNYITNNNITDIDSLIISFNETNFKSIDCGFIFCKLLRTPDIGRLVFKLSKYNNSGLRTSKLGKLMELLSHRGKKIQNYVYLSTIKGNDNDLITFREEKNING